jgi:acid stress-induced BolA-like protein IbaG/YrbA
MTLQILSTPPPEPEAVTGKLAECIEQALEGAQVTVSSGGPGHFELDVVWPGFEGKRRVAQQQLVYGAIAHLMAGDAAPVHAIDKMVTRTA